MHTLNPFDALHERLDRVEGALATLSTTKAEAKQTEIITRDVLCQRLNISEPTAIRWDRKGKIPSIRIGSSVRYNWYSVLEALENKKRGEK